MLQAGTRKPTCICARASDRRRELVTNNYWTSPAAHRVSRRDALRGAAIGVAGLAGAALIGCGGGEKSEGKPTASGTGAAPTAATSAPAAAQPRSGGRLARAQAGDPVTFDQHGQSTTYVNLVSSPMFNTLVQFDPKDGDEKSTGILPDLADSWQITPDGQTYVFKLKQGVKFHDGTPFVAADVKASLERQITPPKGLVPPRQDQLKIIKTMEIPDDFTLKMSMSRPVSPLSMLSILGQGWMAIYSQKDAKDEKFDWKNKANGTGPYRDMKYERGVKVTMEKNKAYHVKDRPYLDGLDVFIMPQESSRDAALQAGQIQLGGMAAGSAESLKKAIGDKAIYSRRPSHGFSVLNYNSSKAPWNNERVRRAVNMAISREDAIKVVPKGDGVVGGYHLPGGEWALPDAEIRKIPGYEPQGPNSVADAKKMLAAAGVKDGLNIVMLIRLGSENLGLFTADQLAKVGINAKQDVQETAIAYDRLNKRDFDLCPWGHAISLDDPDAIWQEMYLQGAPRNYSELSSPEIEAVFMKQTVELDPAKRKALVLDMQKVSMPILGKAIYYWSISQTAQYKQVQGWVPHVSVYNNQKMQDVWLSA
ncbi:MAG: ABC transporter substrate-binding protein [Dehalococcoidia bacterium]|nr:MAG: ABC transporter substrate-binding protein [Dehalococcoidia bacterium]